MRALKSYESPRVAGSCAFGYPTQIHQCPVCGARHEVTAVRAQFAYGRQLSCSPDCEGQRRRLMRAVPGVAGTPVLNDAKAADVAALPVQAGDAARPAARAAVTAIGRGAVVMLPVVVESVDVPLVRRAVFQPGRAAVDMLEAAPVPRSSKVRLLLRISASALEEITAAIMRTVPAGEFGRIGRVA